MHFLSLLCYTLLILVNFINLGEAQCLTDQKVCDNGECIEETNWCDGKYHCTDKSDETNKCLEVRCPRYTFRCAYGACITNNLKCDGKNDCADGSDESTIECSGIKNMSGSCGEFEVQCQNLQCISQDDACDGKRDCTDGSDETTKTCAKQRCPHYAFQCAYGACIPKKNKCDGKEDCADGSDELDGCDNRIGVSRPVTNVTQEVPEQGGTQCYVPRSSLLTLVDTNTNLILRQGTSAPIFTSVKYLCPKGAFLIGRDTNFCEGREWVNKEHPKCIKMCSPLDGHTIKPVCNLDGIGVQCNKPVRPGTTAKITCEVMYEKPRDRHVNEDLHCQGDGDWDYAPFKCEQTCGVVDTKIAFSVNSQITKVHSVPWNVGIYQRNQDRKFEHICGGTLIRSKIIISAAHCFWDSTIGKAFDKSNYIITVGKFYRDFYANNETEVIQTKTLSKIDIPLTFNGANYDYANDIAVLTLNDHIKFNSYVRPACLTWKVGNEQYVTSGKFGVVAGWGITDGGEFSPDLRSVELETIDYDTCTKRKLKPTDKIANDKFCVETSEGKNVCQGDSGGGFVVAETINNVQYFYLWGLVSNGIISRVDGTVQCNSNFITSFTNVQFYEYLVTRAIKNAYQSI